MGVRFLSVQDNYDTLYKEEEREAFLVPLKNIELHLNTFEIFLSLPVLLHNQFEVFSLYPIDNHKEDRTLHILPFPALF